MSGCLGRDLQKKLSSLAEVPVGVFEFRFTRVTLLGQREI